ncbi:hypothetical protein TNCV_2472551 [Trichonephila clavipes]|nr:hypothetical protein TNCV_2472551 [Trichonephila clavipes]
MEAKHVNEFRPDNILWEKISKGLFRNPDRPLKNTDKRMVYIYNNMFFVKKTLLFASLRLRCPANPYLLWRSFEPYDHMLYHRMVLEPHKAYPNPDGTRYILLMVQKTFFGLDIIHETILPQFMENGFNLGDFRKMKRYDQKSTIYFLLPRLMYLQRQTNTFGRTARAFLQTEQSVYHTRQQTTSASCVDCQTFHCLFQPSTREYSRASCADTSDPSTRSTCADTRAICADSRSTCADTSYSTIGTDTTCADDTTFSALFTIFTICADYFTTCGQDFGADPYGRLFNRSDHVVRIWRLLATRFSLGSYPRTPVAWHGAFPV